MDADLQDVTAWNHLRTLLFREILPNSFYAHLIVIVDCGFYGPTLVVGCRPRVNAGIAEARKF